MGDASAIEWTDATWPVVTGCSVVSPGCANCYAMREAGGRLRNHPRYAGLTRSANGRPVFNGAVRLNEELLDQPLRWRKPRRVFVPSMGDLFHESVPVRWIDNVFDVMARAPQHTFQVLTKRSKRMEIYVRLRFVKKEPLPNVWLGVSAEDQTRADQRIPDLLATPAAVRFVSAEPLLGPIDLHWAKLNWVIVGGESGPGARPMHRDWARSLRDQCQAAGVPFFFKQWGEWGPIDKWMPWGREPMLAIARDGSPVPHDVAPEDMPGGQRFRRVGKKAAGRLLDGRTWDEMPGQASGIRNRGPVPDPDQGSGKSEPGLGAGRSDP